MVSSFARDRLRSGKRWFVACPMSSFATETEYAGFRERVLNFCKFLETAPGVSGVFFAGSDIGKFADFDEASDALKTDADRIWDCSNFVLLYPRKILSSALVEIGIALGLELPVTIVCADRADLPYVLQSADKSASSHVSGLRIIESTFSDSDLRSIAGSMASIDDCVAAE